MKIENIATHRLVRVLRVVVPVLILALVAIPAWNYFSSRKPDSSPNPIQALPEGLAVRTEGFSLSRTEGGRTLFSIKAKTQLGFVDNKYALEDVEVIVHGSTESDQQQRIVSKTCSYDEATGGIVFSGGVTVDLDATTRVRTEELVYSHNDRLVSSAQRTFIEQPEAMNGEADRFEYALASGLLKLTGNVKVQAADGAALQGGAAVFHRLENWATVTDGLYLSSANGWVRGATGRAQLEAATFRPTSIVVENNVHAETKDIKVLAGFLEAQLDENGSPTSVSARGDVEVERRAQDSSQTLRGDEVDASVDASGKVSMLEARGRGRMVLGKDRTLTSARIRSTAAGTVSTEGPSVMQLGDSRLEGRDFIIDDGPVIRFSTTQYAVLTSGARRTSAERTEARFDQRTNQLIELRQNGNFQFDEGAQHASAGSATFENNGGVATLEGSPVFVDADRRLEAGTIRLNKADNSFSARTNVKTVTKNTGEPILISSDEAEGAGAVVIYTGRVRLWQGKVYIEARRLEASQKENLLTASAEGAVKSNFETVRAASDRLEYDDKARFARYTGNVSARRQGMLIESAGMLVKLAEKTPDVVEIQAGGGVVVTRGEQRGVGEDAVYTAAKDEVILTGKPARVNDKQHGVIEGARFVMNEKGSKITVDGGPDGRATATRKIKK